MNDENDWIYEAILNFLNSSTWRIPVTEFITNNCFLFSKKGEKRKEKMEVHKNFVELINKLLNDLYLEIGITKEQFDKTCKKSYKIPERKAIISSLTKLFDYDYFKNIMYRKNAELKNAEAMKMQTEIKKQNISMAFQQIPIPNNQGNSKIKDIYSQLIPQNQGAEAFQIEEALRQSMEEEELKQKTHVDEEQDQLEEALRLSKLEFLEFENSKNSQNSQNSQNLKDPKNSLNSKMPINNNINSINSINKIGNIDNLEEGPAIGEEISVKNDFQQNEIIQNEVFNENLKKMQFPNNISSNYSQESNNLQMLETIPKKNYMKEFEIKKNNPNPFLKNQNQEERKNKNSNEIDVNLNLNLNLKKPEVEGEPELNNINNYPNFADVKGNDKQINLNINTNQNLKLDKSEKLQEPKPKAEVKKAIFKSPDEAILEKNFTKMNLEGASNILQKNINTASQETNENENRKKEKAEKLKQLLSKVKNEEKKKQIQESQPNFMKNYNALLEKNDNEEQIPINNKNININPQNNVPSIGYSI